MYDLGFWWGIALIVTLGALPVGIIRTVIYRSGDIDHTPTMKKVAIFATTLGLLGLVALIALSVAWLLRR